MIHYLFLALFVVFMAFMIVGFNKQILDKNQKKDD